MKDIIIEKIKEIKAKAEGTSSQIGESVYKSFRSGPMDVRCSIVPNTIDIRVYNHGESYRSSEKFIYDIKNDTLDAKAIMTSYSQTEMSCFIAYLNELSESLD